MPWNLLPLPLLASLAWGAALAGLPGDIGVQAAAEAEDMARGDGRPAGSAAEEGLARAVEQALQRAGWAAVREEGGLVACRPPGRRLFLAHLDSVPGSPGAVDNAAGVAALLAIARHSAAEDLCLGFPFAEETGLEGSRALAAGWLARHGALPRLVVALDLTGHGHLSVTGLGPAWGGAQLAWLTEAATLDSPYAYRVVSRALPGMERSDHLPFAARGVLSMHLLGRGEGGVFPRYHQPEDRTVDAAAMQDLVLALEGLATAPLPPEDAPDAAVIVRGRVLPSPLVWLGIVLGLLSGVEALLRPGEGRPVLGALSGLWASAWRAVLGALAATLPMLAMTRLRLFDPSEAERTAAAVMGTSASGWWEGAGPGLVLGWAGWFLLRRRLGPRGSAPLAAATLCLLALWVDPLLALPFGLASLLCRIHPLLGVLPSLYLLVPDKLRELSFHGLLPPGAWGALWLLAWPAMGAPRRPR